ncbi:MAG: enoyl-CoA hydratase/isomerase family protein [Ignavibacteriaceae bacterium]
MDMFNYTEKNNIGVILLNRPEKRNALHPKLIQLLTEKLIEIENDKNVKVVIISGEGKSFSAGADLEYLNMLNTFSILKKEEDSENLGKMFLQLYNLSKPTIAAVNGAAIAGGCGLASCCDFIIADKQNAKFGYSEIKIGFIPAIVSIFLIKKIGEGYARQMLLSGEIFTAQRAYEIGLANSLSNDVIADAFSLGEKLLENSAFSMSITKNIINDISNLGVENAVKYCINLNTIARTSEDFKFGIEKFLNKN